MKNTSTSNIYKYVYVCENVFLSFWPLAFTEMKVVAEECERFGGMRCEIKRNPNIWDAPIVAATMREDGASSGLNSFKIQYNISHRWALPH